MIMEMMDELEFQKNRRKEAELRKFVSQLDTMGEMLYNNLEYNGVWDLVEKFEELRIKYYTEHYEYEEILKRGKNVKD